jgi:hypothetical protein
MPNWEQLYDEAVSRERFIRDVAYLGIPEKIGNFKVKPMTLWHVLALRSVGSPFICGGKPTVDDATVFLWQLSLEYSPSNLRGKRRNEKACRRAWRGKPVEFWETVIAIHEFIEEVYSESPCHSSTVGGKSYYSECAGICDSIGAAYGWDIEKTMNTPLKQVFQQLKILRAREKAAAGKQPIMANPSDKIIGEMLAEETAKSLAVDLTCQYNI